MPLIKLRRLFHRGKENIGIYVEPYPYRNPLIRNLKSVVWSRTHGCWYLPMNKENYDVIHSTFQGRAEIDDKELLNFLGNKKGGLERIGKPKEMDPLSAEQLPSKLRPGTNSGLEPRAKFMKHQIDAVNMDVIPLMEQCLKLKGYSSSTIRTYINEITQFLGALKDHAAKDLEPSQLKRYFVYCYEKLHLQENTLHSRINALKFYYEQVLGREKFFWEIPRPKKRLILPKLLSENELVALFNALTNIKHKAMLFTAYSAGLRVSEIAALKIKDIDSGRMQIFVERAKGKKGSLCTAESHPTGYFAIIY